MSGIKLIFLKKYYTLFGIILSALGIATSCRNRAVEYGVLPENYKLLHAKYNIEGIIYSAKDSSRLRNIRVTSEYFSTYSNDTGYYYLEESDYIDIGEITKYLVFDDCDGVENGEYESKTIIVNFSESELIPLTDSDNDYEATKTVDITLTPKK